MLSKYYSLVLIFLLIVISQFSCKTNHNISVEKKSIIFKPIYATAEADFKSKHYLSFFDIETFSWKNLEFNNHDSKTIALYFPTLFINYDPYLIYPGDSIDVEITDDFQLGINYSNNIKHQNESDFLKVFSKKWIQSEGNIKNRNTDKESSIFNKITEITRVHESKMSLLDSLLNATTFSDTSYSRIIYLFYKSELLNNITSTYESNKNLLIADGIYKKIYLELLQKINNITSVDEIHYGLFYSLDKVADALLTPKINLIQTQNDFEVCFKNAIQLFTGVSRDYILTKLMNSGFQRKVSIKKPYWRQYFKYCNTNFYKKLANEWLKKDNFYNSLIKENGTNTIQNYAESNVTSIESILAKYSGKIIVLDFWASWCLPCIKELPFEKSLKEAYKGKGIIFIKISTDKDFASWRSSILKNKIDFEDNYVLLNSRDSKFLIENKIDKIPQYIIVASTGKFVYIDSLRPSVPRFRQVLDSIIAK